MGWLIGWLVLGLGAWVGDEIDGWLVWFVLLVGWLVGCLCVFCSGLRKPT
jgi:membrane protein DedA with SNARE-associated domain